MSKKYNRYTKISEAGFMPEVVEAFAESNILTLGEMYVLGFDPVGDFKYRTCVQRCKTIITNKMYANPKIDELSRNIEPVFKQIGFPNCVEQNASAKMSKIEYSLDTKIDNIGLDERVVNIFKHYELFTLQDVHHRCISLAGNFRWDLCQAWCEIMIKDIPLKSNDRRELLSKTLETLKEVNFERFDKINKKSRTDYGYKYNAESLISALIDKNAEDDVCQTEIDQEDGFEIK